MSKRGIGFVAANGIGIKKYGERRSSGTRKLVVLDGDKIYMQNKEASKKTRINYEHGQHVRCLWAPVKEGEVAKETEEVLQGNRFAMLATESEDKQVFTRRV